MTAVLEHLMETACSCALTWRRDFWLAFNISPRQFQDENLQGQIEAICARTGFPFSRLQLEITESALIDDLETARTVMARLKRLGAQFVLDDFGTGYSSLTWLQALPFDKLKIDARFVRSMTTSRDSRKIVSAVIGLGQSLNMPVVAEGIETTDQALMLARLGCDFGQGYLYAHPSRAAMIPDILNSLGQHTHETKPVNLSCNLRLAQLNSIYESAPFALCFIDMSRRFVSANQEFAQLIGLDLGQIIGRRVVDLFPHATPLMLDVLRSAATENILTLPESVSADGRRNLLSTISVARDEDKEIVGVSVTIIDITKYKSSVARRTFGRRQATGQASPELGRGP